MKKVISIKIARVYSHSADGSAKIERNIVKVEEGDNFNKFVKYLPLKGLLESEPPKVVSVKERKDNKSNDWVDVEIASYQRQIDSVMAEHKSKSSKPVDYKAAYEAEKKSKEDILRRLEALENANKPKADDTELEDLRIEYEILFNKSADKRKGIEALRAEIEAEKAN